MAKQYATKTNKIGKNSITSKNATQITKKNHGKQEKELVKKQTKQRKHGIKRVTQRTWKTPSPSSSPCSSSSSPCECSCSACPGGIRCPRLHCPLLSRRVDRSSRTPRSAFYLLQPSREVLTQIRRYARARANRKVRFHAWSRATIIRLESLSKHR